jgi:hypothetical protein
VSIDWSRGPVASLLGRNDQNSGPSIGSYAARGARYGSVGGPLGAAAGGLIGAFAGWLGSRNWQGELASMSNDRPQPDYGGGINWDADIGGPHSAGERMGPPSNLAGGGTMPQVDDPRGGPAWYDDVTMGADDPMGLVPDYGSDGPDENGDGHMSPQERRDMAESGGVGGFANYGVSQFSPGVTLITGYGDPNGRYRNRGSDYGG